MVEPSDRDIGYVGIRVIVLGATGFIGRWVARALGEHGAQVHLVVRDRATAELIFTRYDIQGSIFELDLREPSALNNLFQEIRPSVTFNLAGYGVDRSERDETIIHQINTHLVGDICQVIEQTQDPDWKGQVLVHVGSALEYGTIGGNLSEDSIPNPTTLYGKTKLAGTQSLARCCQARGVKGLTARLFTVYGPGEHTGRLLPSLLQTARTGEALKLTTGVQERDFTYVEDVAEGLLCLGLATAQPGEIVNLATGHLTSVRSFVETGASILGIANDRLQFGALPTRAEEMEHQPVTTERLQRLIGWVPPTSIADGIRKTLEFE